MAWRQLRAAVLGTTALTGLVVVALVVLGTVSRDVGSRLTAACAANDPLTCESLQLQLDDLFSGVARYLGYLPLTGVLIAAVWGAPMISREIESGTAALAWHQSITRRRWFAARLTVSLAVLATLGLALGFTVTWWAASFDALPRAELKVAGIPWGYGPVVPAQWIAGLTIGVLIGTLARRTLPAAAVTAVVTFAGVITVNLAAGLPDGDPSSGQQILSFQLDRAVPMLLVAAVAGVLCFRQVARVRV